MVNSSGPPGPACIVARIFPASSRRTKRVASTTLGAAVKLAAGKASAPTAARLNTIPRFHHFTSRSNRSSRCASDAYADSFMDGLLGRSLDDVVGAQAEGRRDRQAQDSGRLEIHDQAGTVWVAEREGRPAARLSRFQGLPPPVPASALTVCRPL